MINIVNTIFTAIALFFTWLFFKKRNCDSLLGERYKKLIFPMFDTLEPYLYHKYTLDVYDSVKKVMSIYQKNKMYSTIRMREQMHLYNFAENISNKDFQILCNIVDREYDSCCTKLGIKKRSMRYRIIHKQYRNLWQIVSVAIQLSIFNTIIAFVISFFISLGFNTIINLLTDLI